MTENKTIKEIIIEQLSTFNVKNIYGYPGDTILEFISALKKSPIKFYSTRHEETAGLMASAEAKLDEKLAVCTAHSGPGTANIINGIADAYSDRASVLLITGQVPTHNVGTNYKQYVNQQQLTEPLTVYSGILINPEAIIDILYKAMIKAITRGGVSHVIIPMDMWNKTTQAQIRKYPQHIKRKIDPDPDLIDKAIKKINNSNKPVILYGRGAQDCQKQLKKISEKIGAALINSLPAANLIEYNFSYSLGGLGQGGSEQASHILNQSDLVLIIGTNWWPMDYTPRLPEVIQLDIIKENLGNTHPVEIGILGDIKTSLKQFLEKNNLKKNHQWEDQIKQAHKEWLNNLKNNLQNNDFPLHPSVVMNTISENIKKDEIIALDSGDNVIWFSKYFKNKCKKILISGTWRTMGFSLPAAMAAKINKPEQPVTAIIGDGGLLMVLAELLTVYKYKLNIRILLINNGSLAMEKNKMKAANLTPDEVSLNNPDFKKLANIFNLEAYRVKNIEELNDILTNTEKSKNPVLVNIPTNDIMPPETKL
ncbi:MAG: thiamine pyrophosphate-binding protein [Bacillota bacterium]